MEPKKILIAVLVVGLIAAWGIFAMRNMQKNKADGKDRRAAAIENDEKDTAGENGERTDEDQSDTAAEIDLVPENPESETEKPPVRVRYLNEKQIRFSGDTESTLDAPLYNSLGMAFRRIPSGEFEMGDEKKTTRIETPFYLAAEEVSARDFAEFLNQMVARNVGDVQNYVQSTDQSANNVLSRLDKDGNIQFYVQDKNEQHPANAVSWIGATRFCEWLSEREKNFGYSYRLPTEAEWEFACRAYSDGAYTWGDKIGGHLENIDRAGKGTVATASYTSNAFGLYDMHGNVSEWTASPFGSKTYLDGSEARAAGPEEDGPRAVKGGSFNSPPAQCRIAFRAGLEPRAVEPWIGFRVVLVVNDIEPLPTAENLIAEYERKIKSAGETTPDAPSVSKTIRTEPQPEISGVRIVKPGDQEIGKFKVRVGFDASSLKTVEEDGQRFVNCSFTYRITDPAGRLRSGLTPEKPLVRKLPTGSDPGNARFDFTVLFDQNCPDGIYNVEIRVRDIIGGREAATVFPLPVAKLRPKAIRPRERLAITDQTFDREIKDDPLAFSGKMSFVVRGLSTKIVDGTRTVHYSIAISVHNQHRQKVLSLSTSAPREIRRKARAEIDQDRLWLPFDFDKDLEDGIYTIEIEVTDHHAAAASGKASSRTQVLVDRKR